MNVDRPPPKDDILHLSTSLEWREYSGSPKSLPRAPAVCLEDKLYIGGYKLYIYTHTTDTWATKDTPVQAFALVVYHSQLVLVGGWMTDDESATNKLWTLDRHNQLKETLPPMTVGRMGASAVEYSNNIIVAGGWSADHDGGGDIDSVDVYNGNHWAKAQSLPIACHGMKPAILNGHWYLAGGEGQGKEIYYASLESLIASCQPSGRHLPSVWSRLADVPHALSILVAFGNRLVAIGYRTSPSHAYSPYSQSWVHVGDKPGGGSAKAAAVLPSGELMVAGDGSLYRRTLYGYQMNAEEEKHIAAIQKAMEERGMLDHTIVHGVFVGPARSGKNSIMERLLGRMPSTVSPSTGVAESVVHVKVIQKSTTFATNVKNKSWSIMDYDDEAIKLMVINSESQNQVVIPYISEPDAGSEEFLEYSEVESTPSTETQNPTGKTEASSNSQTHFDTQQSLPDIPASSHGIACSSVRPPALPISYMSAIEIVKFALRKKKGIDTLQQHFLKTWSLYLTNTGGQMEYQEVLPLLVSGPSIFFSTFRLDRDLNKPYSIEYELADGSNAKPYTSTLTTLEGILQTLATISAMGTFVYNGLQKRNVPLRPKVFLIGTHKDRLKSKKADAIIAKVDDQLQQAIKSTSHYEELVEFAYPSQMIFTVNNFSESESDFDDIRSAVNRVVVRDEFKMTSPAHWLIFSLALRKIKSPVITYKECMEIGKQCGVPEDELDEALHFIHSKMGLIRYFPYKEIKHLLVIDPQHLFDKVTELIVSTFTFEKAGKQVMDAFKQKGIFSLIEFEKISSKTESGMKASEFAKLLEKLRIAAPFKLKGTNSIMYFIPCVLAHVEASRQSFAGKLISKLSLEDVPSLIVTFKCGYCPKGLAGALISYLMANEMESKFSWDLCHEEIFRNQVSFRVGPLDTIVLKIYSTYLKIKFIEGKLKHSNRRCTVGEVCSEVCKAIETGIYQVTSDINYINAQHFLTFRCGCGGDHPGVLEFVDDIPHNLSCSKRDKVFPLPKGHEVWQITSCKTIHQKSDQSKHTNSHLSEQHGLNIQLEHEQSLAASPEHRQPTQLAHKKVRLTENHHSMLMKHFIKHAARWRQIGTILGFRQGELNSIEIYKHAPGPENWLSKMLAEWLQWAPGDSRGSQSFATMDVFEVALGTLRPGATANNLDLEIRTDEFINVDSTTILGEKDLKQVLKEVSPLKPRYFQLGVALSIPAHELETLQKQYGAVNYDQALNEMILLWLRGRTSRTWQALVRAVDSETGGKNHPLALEIASRHKAVGAYMP